MSPGPGPVLLAIELINTCASSLIGRGSRVKPLLHQILISGETATLQHDMESKKMQDVGQRNRDKNEVNCQEREGSDLRRTTLMQLGHRDRDIHGIRRGCRLDHEKTRGAAQDGKKVCIIRPPHAGIEPYAMMVECVNTNQVMLCVLVRVLL